MAPKPRPAVPSAEAPEESYHGSRDTPSPPLDDVALVLEQMALINARLDEQATDATAQRQHDAHHDTPTPTIEIEIVLQHNISKLDRRFFNGHQIFCHPRLLRAKIRPGTLQPRAPIDTPIYSMCRRSSEV
jgi:hypothetical protein